MRDGLRAVAATVYGGAWEARRRAYALGWVRPSRVPARVVSVGNLTVGGTGKTTLVTHLMRRARALGAAARIVCRDYHPGPHGHGDEAILYRRTFGERSVLSGTNKRALARAAAQAGGELILVDDGFSHWALERDLDVVLLDARDPWGGGRLLPAGRLREPRQALQRAEVVVLSRLGPSEDPATLAEEVRRFAPAAFVAAGRHHVIGLGTLDGRAATPRRAWVVTGTGRPAAVASSAAEAGLEVTGTSIYRDHHWFSRDEARRERQRARAAGSVVLLTAKDAVRWPAHERGDEEVVVLKVEWRWVSGGDTVEALVFGASTGVSVAAGNARPPATGVS